MVGRIQVGAVVGGQLDELHGPAFTVGQVAFFQAGKKGLDLFDGVFMGEIVDLGGEGWWVTEDIVFQKN